MKLLSNLSFSAAALLLPALAHAYANPGACSGTCTNTHDPSIIRRDSDGTYFRFSTGGKIAVHTASDLTGSWTYLGAAIPAGSSINLTGNDDLWAPDVSKVGDTYYLYYSVSSFGSQDSAIGVATSSDLETWTDHGSTGISSSSSKSYNAIDPNLISADGTYYLTFGSFWTDIYQVAMDSSPTAAAAGAAAQVAYDPVTTAEEGAFVFQHGDYYYLFYSKGQCCGYDASKPAAGGEYKIMACRSSSSATGDFVDADGTDCTNGGGTVVLESHDNVYGPGGQGVYDDPTRGPVLYYHYVDTTIGYANGDKQFGWNTIDFSSGWPVV